ncbi:MAG: hypothetical protein V4819_12685 [Verrucomicrobiota bacterium]
MTRTNLILTHGTVFAVGIAGAMVANSFRGANDEAARDAAGLASRSHSAGAAGRFEKDGISPSSRSGKDEHRLGSKKELGAAVDRLAGVVRITDAFERQRALMDLIDTLGPAEFAGVADQFRELDHIGDTRGEYALLLRGWAKADPLTALEYVAKHPGGEQGRSTILSTWAGNDAAGAERWALDHHEGDGPNPYMASVIRGVAGNDVAEASRMAQSMPLSRERGEAVDAITQALFLQGIDAAMAFPATITDEALRGGFVAAIANRLIGKDVNKAAEWVASMPQGDIQNRAARSVADALANKDTQAAAAWVRTLKPEAQSEAARGVIPVMSRDDIAGTARWVSGLVGTPNYDNVVEEFVWSCNTRAPEQSAAWIQGVSDPQQQRRLFQRMLGEWAQKDAAAVKQWVASNTVPDDIRRRFLR